jgi:hypothetical protein
MSRNYYLLGKYVYEQQKLGHSLETIQAILASSEMIPALSNESIPTLSKMKKVYETFVIKYGFTIDELEHIHAHELYDTIRKPKKSPYPPLIMSKADAKAVFQRINSGEKWQTLWREHTGKTGIVRVDKP